MYMQIIKITTLGLCVLEGLEEKIIVNTENEIIIIIIIIIKYYNIISEERNYSFTNSKK